MRTYPGWKAGNPRYVPVLEKRLRFVGDGVALVAAASEEIAEEALRLIRVEYEELAPVFDVEEAMRPARPSSTPNSRETWRPAVFLPSAPTPSRRSSGETSIRGSRKQTSSPKGPTATSASRTPCPQSLPVPSPCGKPPTRS